MSEQKPSPFDLVKVRTGDASEEERVREAVKNDPALKARASELEKNATEYEAERERHFAQLRDTIAREPKREARSKTRWFLIPAFAAAVIAIMVINVLPPNGITYKGPFAVQIVAKRGDKQFVVRPEAQLLEGDALRFSITSDRPGFLSVFSITAEGVTPFYPETPSGPPLAWEKDGQAVLPDSIVLDDALGTEHLVVLFSESSFDRNEVHQRAAEQLRANDLKPEWFAGEIVVVTVSKVREAGP